MPPNPQNLKPPWPAGVSGNPKGRPPRKKQVDDLLQMIDETPGMERAISKAWMKQILAGSLPHLKEYLERRDGKVPTPVEASISDASGNDFVTILPPDDQAGDTATEAVLD
jgi:hypothetical protein